MPAGGTSGTTEATGTERETEAEVERRRDVEGRREASAELERRAAELETVFRALNDRCVRIDADGHVLKLLAGYPAYLPADRIEGKHIREILGPDDAQRIEDALAQLQQRRAPVTVEYDAVRRDGKRHIEARIVPFGEHEAIAVLRDVTDRHRAVEALREAEERQRASQKMEALGRLAGGVAHDFNNLLTIMLSCADLLARSVPASSLTSTYLAELSGAAQRGAGLTRQLLTFSHKQPMQPRLLEVSSVVSELKTMLGRLIGENIELVTELSERTGTVRADRGQVEQVLVNLVVNARDALGERGGRIVIATKEIWAGDASVRSDDLPPGRYAALIVKDNGIGMTDEVKAHLFEPFFTTKARGKGTGLGLATVYGIVKQSDGYVRVRSAPGEGAELEVLFPSVKEEATERVTPRMPSKRPGGSETVLLVEDEAPLRRLVAEILEEAGYRVVAAANAEEAIARSEQAAAKNEGIDLLLSDVVMPGLGGPELLARLRMVTPAMPVLFMSGYEEVTSVGDEPAIAKPFSASAIARRVRAVLDGRPKG